MEHTLGITAAALILAAAVILCIFALTGFFGKEKAAKRKGRAKKGSARRAERICQSRGATKVRAAGE